MGTSEIDESLTGIQWCVFLGVHKKLISGENVIYQNIK